MSDKIAEIRARHEEGVRAGADEDRAYLLAEVERLRAEVEKLRAALMEISQYETNAPAGFEWDIVVEELVEIARKALEAKP
jgi:hypothetical protein